MGSRDRRVDRYIARARPFARPILRELRARVHAACPAVTETIKWGMPFFEHGGPLCFMAAFQQHCAFGFWKSGRVLAAGERVGGAMGQLGRLRTTSDLPSRRALHTLIRRAVRQGAAAARPARPPRRPPPRLPADLGRALAARPAARATYRALPPSGRREYVEWLTGAKRAETRARRLARAVSRLAAGQAFDGRRA
ncbi:MAG: YdeI/OmpD-associated family protein [Proteobacteria bacterium]|nr:YdeI/OmpD-associated family protein [Pseudomonadota bacterium]